ncbi:MAG: DUF4926 domain-containing protein [Anaerolineae bacterium]|nr:DUF4926 domain-containing protein [Anaerolineae bacterium]
MKLELYQEIALRRDIPEYGLKKGDVALLIDYVPHPSGGEDGCILEIFNAIGESIKIAVVPYSAVKALEADEVPSVRPLRLTSRDAA